MESAIFIPWHEKIWENFSNARIQNHLPHALLITGAKGTGKELFSDRVVKSLLCTQLINSEACNQCTSCKTYNSNANPDYLEVSLLEGKQQITVDQIRQLSQFLNFTRSFEGYRVVLIRSIEKMNRNAANSLLKSLEEPTGNTIIILISDNISSVLPTIKSRCQKLFLPQPSREIALSWLQEANKNNKKTDLKELLELSNGSPIGALDIPENMLLEKKDFSDDIFSVLNGKKSIIEIAKKWEKYDLDTLLNWQISWASMAIKKALITQSNTLNINDLPEYLARKTIPIKLWLLYSSLVKQKQYIHTSVNTLIFVEKMVMLWLNTTSASH